MSSTGVDPALASTLDEVDGIEGWLPAQQAVRLWNAARRLRPPARIVEIGSFQGRSTIVLARAAADGVEVVAIDPHAGNDRGPLQWRGTADEGASDNVRFQDNLRRARVAHRVTHVRLRSQQALGHVAGGIDLLYIDGAHGYGPAVSDVRQWGDRVTPGGIMLIHDAYLSVGVTAALARLLFFGRSFRFVGRSRSMVEYERVPVRGAAYLRNVALQLQPLPWFGRNTAVRLLLIARLPRVARLLGYRGGGLC